MSDYLGELAALGTSVLFAGSSVFNTNAGRQVGSVVVNRMRLVFAVGWLLLAHLILRIPLPWQAGAERWFWLSASGIVGLAIGDAFLFQAFVWIGPRISMMLMALAPIISGILAWLFLGEVLSVSQWAGLLLALLGVSWVILDRRGEQTRVTANPQHYRAGILFGLGGAVGQAVGVILAKRGPRWRFSGALWKLNSHDCCHDCHLDAHPVHTPDPLYLNQVAKHPRATWYIWFASLLGPFLGVTLSLYALQHTAVAIASVLASLSPVVLLPVSHFVYKEKFGWGAVIGTLMVMGGVALFFLT